MATDTNRIRPAPEPGAPTPPPKRRAATGGSNNVRRPPEPPPGEAATTAAEPARIISESPPLSSRGRPRKERSGCSTSIYFYDADKLRKLESVCDAIPHCSVGKVMNQLLDAFMVAYDTTQHAAPHARAIPLSDVTVHL